MTGARTTNSLMINASAAGNSLSLGANTLTLNGGTMSGNIGDNGGGSIKFNQSTTQTLSNVITGESFGDFARRQRYYKV